MQHNITCRRVQADEVGSLGRLGRILFTETFGHLYSVADLNDFLDRVFSDQALTNDLESGRVVWIAELEEWLGYIKMGPLSLPVDTGGRRAVELKQLYVIRPYHGRGVAGLLMDKFVQWARDQQADDLYVSCWSGNDRALAFYKRYGFETVGAYTFWVGQHGDHELILKSSLPTAWSISEKRSGPNGQGAA
ncbi:MAG: GNAT family N-acetyltransferase [Pirellulaceae bacterium]|nr:GNAT family N-acetyltransferase [Pirellulaceae bacterium]